MAHRPLLAIVDDDEALLLSLANLIRSLGFRVERFPSAEAFLSSPERHRTDCLIVDVRMPGMDGPGLVRELAGGRRRISFIFMSAYTDAATLADVSQLGAAGFLQKPCQEADL